MTHSVERHLVVAPSEYDVQIRRFVVGYEQMLDEAVGALREQLRAELPSPVILDLGAGTGALSARVAEGLPHARLLLLDADPEMLAQAESRLTAGKARFELRHASFTDPLPACDAAVASLSLHHVHDRADKCDVYRNVLRALPEGGVLVNADAAISHVTSFSAPIMKRWAEHLVTHGDSEEQARARFTQWAKEDRFFGIDEEIAMLKEAGFSAVDVRFRLGPSSVIVAIR